MITDLGEKVKSFRIKHGMTQKQFAKKCGVSIPTIANIEKDEKYHRPNFITIHKIETVLMEEAQNETE